MNKRIVVHLHDGILLRIESTTDTCKNGNESQNNYTELKKSDQTNIEYDLICIKFLRMQNYL